MPASILTRAAAALLAAFAAAQVAERGPQVFTFLSSVDDTDQPYAMYIPKNYSSDRKWPLVISLHGTDSNHRLNLRRVLGLGNRPGESDAQASRYFPAARDIDFLIASPYARGTMGYQGIAKKDVYDVLGEVKQKFNVDEDRVYLTGLSMGGGGALWLGLTRPDIWAAIAAVCPAPPSGTEELAGNALNVPVRLYQGEIDPVVSAAQTREWRKRLEAERVPVEYIEYPGVRHNAWDSAYRGGAVFEWFARFRREPFPAHVRLTTAAYRHSSAYWVQIDSLTPGVPAFVDAVFTAPGTVTVKTKNLGGITLRLSGHPMLPKRVRTLAINIDGKDLSAAGSTIFLRRGEKGWSLGHAVLSNTAKRAGSEGPIFDALSSRHLYIYGTQATQDSSEVARRRDIAERAANWSTAREHLMLSFRVLSDTEFTDAKEADTNLFLLGNRDTNAALKKLSPSLPLHLNPGAADYGLLYVYPVGGRNVVVNSGLPWWTRSDQAQRPGLPFINRTVRFLQSFDDFILFKGGLDNVVVEGRFDRNWKLPPDAAAKLRSSGAVEVRE